MSGHTEFGIHGGINPDDAQRLSDSLGERPEVSNSVEARPEKEPRPIRVIHAERVFTGTEWQSNVSIVIGSEGNIESIIPRREVEERKSQQAEFKPVEYHAEVVMPAMTDAHNHPVAFGEFYAMEPAFLFGKVTERDFADALKGQLSEREGMQLGLGWDTSTLPNIDRSFLDEVRPEPTVVMDMSYHGSVANSEALRLIEEYVQRMGLEGQLRGHMTKEGHLYEEYAMLGLEVMEQFVPIEKIIASAEKYTQDMRRGGTLFTHDMIMFTPLQLEVYANLSAGARDTIRLAHINPRMLRYAVGKGMDVSDKGLKLVADGSNQSRSALYYDPYLGSDNRGLVYHSEEEAIQAMQMAAQQNMRHVSMHAIGDQAIDTAVAVGRLWQRIAQDQGIDGSAKIEHMSVPRPDAIARAGRAGLNVSPQPNFLPDMIPFSDRFDEDRLQRMVPLRQMVDSGMRVMIGTDGMPNSMLIALHCATQAPHESQRLNLEEALKHATTTAPEYEGAARGRIAPGMPADLVITTNRLMTDLDSNLGLYDSTPKTLSSKLEEELPKRFQAEVKDVLRQGDSVLSQPEPSKE